MVQDKYHLYFLFDLMTGGDLMDVLVAEAKVIKRRIPQGTWKRACFAPKVGFAIVPSVRLSIVRHLLHMVQTHHGVAGVICSHVNLERRIMLRCHKSKRAECQMPLACSQPRRCLSCWSQI